MTNQISIKKTHETMKDRLFEYIKSQYFGENDLLLDAADELLKAKRTWEFISEAVYRINSIIHEIR